MISKTTPQFWQRYASLPPDIRRIADKAYALWTDDPAHGSLHFKKLHPGLMSGVTNRPDPRSWPA